VPYYDVLMYERYVILHTMTQDNLLENVDKDVGIPDGSYHFSYLIWAGQVLQYLEFW
jgi:hypothetical protein